MFAKTCRELMPRLRLLLDSGRSHIEVYRKFYFFSFIIQYCNVNTQQNWSFFPLHLRKTTWTSEIKLGINSLYWKVYIIYNMLAVMIFPNILTGKYSYNIEFCVCQSPQKLFLVICSIWQDVCMYVDICVCMSFLLYPHRSTYIFETVP